MYTSKRNPDVRIFSKCYLHLKKGRRKDAKLLDTFATYLIYFPLIIIVLLETKQRSGIDSTTGIWQLDVGYLDLLSDFEMNYGRHTTVFLVISVIHGVQQERDKPMP